MVYRTRIKNQHLAICELGEFYLLVSNCLSVYAAKQLTSARRLDNRINPFLRRNPRRRVWSPDDALAVPFVDIDNCAAVPNRAQRL